MSELSKDDVRRALERVLSWPPERQADVVRMIGAMEQQHSVSCRLTEEQVAEVRRRLADPDSSVLTVEEVRERFRQRGK